MMTDAEQLPGPEAAVTLVALTKAQIGTVAANQAMIDALIVTLLKSIPTLAGPLLETLVPCESHHGKGRGPESLEAFRATMDHYKGLISAVREC